MRVPLSSEAASFSLSPPVLNARKGDLSVVSNGPLPSSCPSLFYQSSNPVFHHSVPILSSFCHHSTEPSLNTLQQRPSLLAMKVNQTGCSNSRSPHLDDPLNASTSKKILKQKKYSTRYPMPEKPRQKRAVIQDMVRPLKQWLLRHRHNPYPTKGEKMDLAIGSNMSLVQVSNWFANARRRLKNVVQDSKCSWSKRLRMYNQFVQGNAELLSISSNDSIWNSDSEEEETEVEQDEKDTHPHTESPLNEKAISEERDIDVENVDEKEPTSSSEEGDDRLSIPIYKKSMMQRYLSDSVGIAQDQQQAHCPSQALERSAIKRRIQESSSQDPGPPQKRRHLIPNPVLHPRPILPRIAVNTYDAFPQPLFSAFQPMNNAFSSLAGHPLLRMPLAAGQKGGCVMPQVAPNLISHGSFPSAPGLWSPSSSQMRMMMPFVTSRLIHPSCPSMLIP
ncbi:hypothetical protein TCAL_07974 [Tigriopus californicus]|uniref:Homeobox domain-containing protein n=1 Tax=Tigriopus californicus TaxID=6832 RepID=A0A553N8A6_TIGCA|nr:uncharacterized protein LOC131885714 [Tigriopus californicus]TRY61671.1 hypothetical protein TCAL_07974 [Tigriopus californicus]